MWVFIHVGYVIGWRFVFHKHIITQKAGMKPANRGCALWVQRLTRANPRHTPSGNQSPTVCIYCARFHRLTRYSSVSSAHWWLTQIFGTRPYLDCSIAKGTPESAPFYCRIGVLSYGASYFAVTCWQS